MRVIIPLFAIAIATPAIAMQSKPVPIAPEEWLSPDDRTCTFDDCHKDAAIDFTLYIMQDGRVSGCRTDVSSGSRYVDRNICRLLVRSAKFEPATDKDGLHTTGYYRSSVQLITKPTQSQTKP